MVQSLDAMSEPFSHNGRDAVFPDTRSPCYLKLRVGPSMSSDALLQCLAEYMPQQLYWPRSGSGLAYILFADA
eukprot:1023287-Amphidinium_carterae.1